MDASYISYSIIALSGTAVVQIVTWLIAATQLNMLRRQYIVNRVNSDRVHKVDVKQRTIEKSEEIYLFIRKTLDEAAAKKGSPATSDLNEQTSVAATEMFSAVSEENKIIILCKLEGFAVGINDSIYDIQIVKRYIGKSMLNWLNGLRSFIIIQRQNGRSTMYNEFEHVCNTLEPPYIEPKTDKIDEEGLIVKYDGDGFWSEFPLTKPFFSKRRKRLQ